MDARLSEDSADEDEEVAMALLLHQRMIFLQALRQGRRAGARPSRRHPGSYPGKRANKDRRFAESALRLFRQYFGVDGRPPTYDEGDFERRFRMPRSLFMRLYNGITEDPWWQQRPNATGQLQAHPIQKLVAALRVLSYGDAQDRNDEYIELSKTTVHNAVTRLISFILEKYEAVYLRAPSSADLRSITARNAARGLPGCIGSLDCCHWQWTQCPVAFHGQYQKGGRGRQRTIVIETICDEDLWVWHIFAGAPGSNNDLNVLCP